MFFCILYAYYLKGCNFRVQPQTEGIRRGGGLPALHYALLPQRSGQGAEIQGPAVATMLEALHGRNAYRMMGL